MLITVKTHSHILSYMKEFVGVVRVFLRVIYCSYLYNGLDFHLYKTTYLQVMRCVIHLSDFGVSVKRIRRLVPAKKLSLINISIFWNPSVTREGQERAVKVRLSILLMLKELNTDFYTLQFRIPLLF